MAALENLCGIADFETDEEVLTLRIEVGARGNAVVSGSARIVEQARVSIGFSFMSDQSFLQNALEQAIAICEAFPIKDRIA